MSGRTIWIAAVLLVAVAVVVVLQGDSGAKVEAGSVKGKVTIRKDGKAKGDLSGAVVYLEADIGEDTLTAQKTSIHQKDLTFRPDVAVVTVGSTIEFPNDDKVFHNVFSVSSPARFDLGLYKSGTSKSVTFTRAGVVDVYCNIHPDMVAKIKVLDTPYYAITGADGSFSIPGVPPGTYPVVAWQARGAEWTGEVTITAGKAASLDVTLDEGTRPKRHLRKDGTPYGRYK
jgi:plastocyanin